MNKTSPAAAEFVWCDYREHYVFTNTIHNQETQYYSRGAVGPRCDDCEEAYADAYTG